MSRFDDIYAIAAAPVLLEFMGDSISYEDANTDPVSLTGIPTPIVIAEEESDDGQRRLYRTTVTISNDPAGDFKGVADPVIGGIVTIDTVRWTVDDVEPKSSLIVLHLLRVGAIERSRPELRKGV